MFIFERTTKTERLRKTAEPETVKMFSNTLTLYAHLFSFFVAYFSLFTFLRDYSGRGWGGEGGGVDPTVKNKHGEKTNNQQA